MKRSTIILSILLFINLTADGQKLIGVVDYMKVENHNEYLDIEKSWQKIHEVRIKEGMIIGWSVYQVMFKSVKDPYNFVTITWYDAFSKLDKGISEKTLKAAYPEKSDKDWEDFYTETYKSRIMITSGVFHQQLSCHKGLDHLSQYYVVNEINVKPGKSKEYIKLMEEVYKPLYVEAIKNDQRASWSLWSKWPGNMKDFQYVSADGYVSLEQIDKVNYVEYFKKLHPEKNIDQISEKIEELRTIANSEMWKMIYRVLK